MNKDIQKLRRYCETRIIDIDLILEVRYQAKKEVFDNLDKLMEEWKAYVSVRVFNALGELKEKHLTLNSNKKNQGAK